MNSDSLRSKTPPSYSLDACSVRVLRACCRRISHIMQTNPGMRSKEESALAVVRALRKMLRCSVVDKKG